MSDWQDHQRRWDAERESQDRIRQERQREEASARQAHENWQGQLKSNQVLRDALAGNNGPAYSGQRSRKGKGGLIVFALIALGIWWAQSTSPGLSAAVRAKPLAA